MLTKNQIISLEITAASSDGNGIGRFTDADYPTGLVVFVPYTAIGDTIECRITKVEKNCAFGRVERLTAPSPDRIADNGCAVFGKCGGCAWRHISYEAELSYKQAQVTDCVRRIAKLETPVLPIMGSPSDSCYRNKAQYPVAPGERPLIGFYAPRSHRVVAQRQCALQPPVFSDILNAVAEWMETSGATAYDEETHRGLVRHIYIREGEVSGERMVCLVCTSGKLPNASRLVNALKAIDGVCSVLVNLNREKTNVILGKNTFALWGKETINDTLCGLNFRLSPLSFYQVNRSGAEKLYTLAADFADLKQEDVLLDLYCGTGTIGLSMASRVKEVIGVEIVPAAIEDARRNATENGITNARFLCADATDAAKQLEAEGLTPDVVVVDPPRKGCDEQALQTVSRMSPSRLVYISCNPATLARDLARLSELGYMATKIQPVDMFPRTAHVESVVCLSREKADDYIRISVHTKDLQTK